MLTTVGIQTGNRHDSLRDAKTPERCKTFLHAGLDIFLCDIVQHIPEGFVAGEEKDTKAVGLKHSQRIGCIGQGSEDLCMTDEGDFRRVQGFLIDGSRRDCVRLAAHGKLDTLLNIGKGGLSAHSLDKAVGKLRLVNVVEVDHVQDAGAVIAVRGFFYHIDTEVSTHDPDSLLHDLTVTDHDNICCPVYLFKCTRFRNDLGADACGITDRYCNHRFFFCHFYLRSKALCLTDDEKKCKDNLSSGLFVALRHK